MIFRMKFDDDDLLSNPTNLSRSEHVYSFIIHKISPPYKVLLMILIKSC